MLLFRLLLIRLVYQKNLQQLFLYNTGVTGNDYAGLKKIFPATDIAIMSAAVADYTPVQMAKEKIKKTENDFAVSLTKTKDILGCFFIGYYLGASLIVKDSQYYLFVIGFLGSFTTMSAFTYQTINMLNTNILIASSYIIATIILTIAATAYGASFSK